MKDNLLEELGKLDYFYRANSYMFHLRHLCDLESDYFFQVNPDNSLIVWERQHHTPFPWQQLTSEQFWEQAPIELKEKFMCDLNLFC